MAGGALWAAGAAVAAQANTVAPAVLPQPTQGQAACEQLGEWQRLLLFDETCGDATASSAVAPRLEALGSTGSGASGSSAVMFTADCGAVLDGQPQDASWAASLAAAQLQQQQEQHAAAFPDPGVAHHLLLQHSDHLAACNVSSIGPSAGHCEAAPNLTHASAMPRSLGLSSSPLEVLATLTFPQAQPQASALPRPSLPIGSGHTPGSDAILAAGARSMAEQLVALARSCPDLLLNVMGGILDNDGGAGFGDLAAPQQDVCLPPPATPAIAAAAQEGVPPYERIQELPQRNQRRGLSPKRRRVEARQAPAPAEAVPMQVMSALMQLAATAMQAQQQQQQEGQLGQQLHGGQPPLPPLPRPPPLPPPFPPSSWLPSVVPSRPPHP